MMVVGYSIYNDTLYPLILKPQLNEKNTNSSSLKIVNWPLEGANNYWPLEWLCGTRATIKIGTVMTKL